MDFWLLLVTQGPQLSHCHAGALQSTGQPQMPTGEPSVRPQATATTGGTGQPLANSADPVVPLEQAASATAEAAQPVPVGSPPEGGLTSSRPLRVHGPLTMWL